MSSTLEEVLRSMGLFDTKAFELLETMLIFFPRAYLCVLITFQRWCVSCHFPVLEQPQKKLIIPIIRQAPRIFSSATNETENFTIETLKISNQMLWGQVNKGTQII
jgi:hypothetical protein